MAGGEAAQQSHPGIAVPTALRSGGQGTDVARWTETGLDDERSLINLSVCLG